MRDLQRLTSSQLSEDLACALALVQRVKMLHIEKRTSLGARQAVFDALLHLHDLRRRCPSLGRDVAFNILFTGSDDEDEDQNASKNGTR